MNPSFITDGIPILKTQFGLDLREADKWSDAEQTALMNATDTHLRDGEHDSRVALGELIERTRAKYRNMAA